MFGWALSRDVYGLTASPCERIRIADLIGSPKPRERVLDSGELRAIWQITAAGEFPFDPFVRLLLLLGCRRGELAGMRRDELDLAAGLWHLSGERTKNELPRTIPLSRQAVAILAALPVFPGPFVFGAVSGARPIQGFSKFKRRFDRRLAAVVSVPNWTLHDLRRTMRTHLSALPISGVVAELMIGHAQLGIRAVYDRLGIWTSSGPASSYGPRGCGTLSSRRRRTWFCCARPGIDGRPARPPSTTNCTTGWCRS